MDCDEVRKSEFVQLASISPSPQFPLVFPGLRCMDLTEKRGEKKVAKIEVITDYVSSAEVRSCQ
jgi:hypothetical protein